MSIIHTCGRSELDERRARLASPALRGLHRGGRAQGAEDLVTYGRWQFLTLGTSRGHALLAEIKELSAESCLPAVCQSE